LELKAQKFSESALSSLLVGWREVFYVKNDNGTGNRGYRFLQSRCKLKIQWETNEKIFWISFISREAVRLLKRLEQAFPKAFGPLGTHVPNHG
jgi:hypothetical protein